MFYYIYSRLCFTEHPPLCSLISFKDIKMYTYILFHLIEYKLSEGRYDFIFFLGAPVPSIVSGA